MLKQKGLRIWFDEFTLRLGDSLRQSIDKGLSESDYGIVILSHNFFTKKWPQAELNGLVAPEINDQKIVLPVWHEITQEEVAGYSPTMVDRYAVKTSEGREIVMKKVLAVIKPELVESTSHSKLDQKPELESEISDSLR